MENLGAALKRTAVAVVAVGRLARIGLMVGMAVQAAAALAIMGVWAGWLA
jgi:hypothetical protein